MATTLPLSYLPNPELHFNDSHHILQHPAPLNPGLRILLPVLIQTWAAVFPVNAIRLSHPATLLSGLSGLRKHILDQK